MKKNIIHKICFYSEAEYSARNIEKISKFAKVFNYFRLYILNKRWQTYDTFQKKECSRILFKLCLNYNKSRVVCLVDLYRNVNYLLCIKTKKQKLGIAKYGRRAINKNLYSDKSKGYFVNPN